MAPLEELSYYARVVEHGGYAKAARALGIPKSRLSRHVSTPWP
jgi:DNA-binding transcriptional LysR family regulator